MKYIPIAAAKRISKDFDAPIVIVFAIDPETGRQHVTTFGDTLKNCQAAARGGNDLKRHLGWPAELCDAKPARQRRKAKSAEQFSREFRSTPEGERLYREASARLDAK